MSKVNLNNSQDSAFWSNYRQVVASEGVPEKQVIWYWRWAQRFCQGLQDKEPAACTAEEVISYLTRQANAPKLLAWQIHQKNKGHSPYFPMNISRNLRIKKGPGGNESVGALESSLKQVATARATRKSGSGKTRF